VILDDYPGVAISSADWHWLGDAVQIRTPTTPHTGDALVTALAGCRDTGVMRMRTPITAAKAQGVVVCGTDKPSRTGDGTDLGADPGGNAASGAGGERAACARTVAAERRS
jgi:hypothetical protein